MVDLYIQGGGFMHSHLSNVDYRFSNRYRKVSFTF